MVVLATAATVIASQAVISGAFSVARQAVQLGYLPRMRIVHTSTRESGQVYVAVRQLALLVAVLDARVRVRALGELAAAYGIAVTGTIAITTFLFFVVRARTGGGRCGWSSPARPSSSASTSPSSART